MTPGPATMFGAPSPGAPPPGAPKPGRLGRVLEIVFAVVAVLAIAGIVFVSSSARSPGSSSMSGRAPVNASAADAGASPAGAAKSPARTAGTTATPPAGMAQVSLAALPKEVRDVVARIDRGGTFPYRQDGAVFLNRERRLPAEPRGYYREFTVDTPGSSDRGPRRIILGRAGELYYTADHYQTFQWVVRNGGPS